MKDNNVKEKDYSGIIKKIWNENSDNPKQIYSKNYKFIKLKDIVDTISLGEYFVYIVNPYLGEFEYVSSQIKDILGYNPEDFNLELYVDLAHPEDLPYIIDIQKKVSEFTINNIPTDRMQYKFCYDFRVRDINGNYHQLYIQYFYLELSEKHNPQRAFCFLTDISHIKTGGIPHLNIFKLGEGLVKILNENQDNKITLTNKENQIFEFLIKGFTSQDIANVLEISKYTVDTHRKNILKRNHCANTSELLSLYFNR